MYLDKSFKTQLPGLQVVEKQFSDIQVNGTPMLAPKINKKKRGMVPDDVRHLPHNKGSTY